MGNLFVILGATGVGKTDISIKLANMLDCAIISSDSRQIYKEMSIGTAKPTQSERLKAKHYFISTRSITDNYSSGQYELDAIPIIESEISKHNNALLVGGSMLYIDAICRGIDDIPTILPEVRNYITDLYETKGLDAIRSQLLLLDPAHYKKVDLSNAKRIMHALEVCIQTGKPISQIHTGTIKERSFNIVKIGLQRDREELYSRINRRVEVMMEEGLEQEAQDLYKYKTINALNTVGYKELFNYFDGILTKEYSIEMIKQNSRRYAKKQISWFNRDKSIHWFHPDDQDSIITFIKSQI